MVQYDPNVIHQHAQRLYDRALGIMVIYGVSAGLLGLFGGAAVGSTLSDVGGVLAVFSATLLGAFGVLIGRARGFELRLQAQTALCQVQIEINSRSRIPQTHAVQPTYQGAAQPR